VRPLSARRLTTAQDITQRNLGRRWSRLLRLLDHRRWFVCQHDVVEVHDGRLVLVLVLLLQQLVEQVAVVFAVVCHGSL
jgi:hypothetical protein